MEFQPLSAPGLVLDLFTEADEPLVAEYCRDPEIPRWTPLPADYSLEDAQRYVRHFVPDGWADGSALTWAIREILPDGSPRLVGSIGTKHTDAVQGEIGYWLAAFARGRGLTERALRAVLHWLLSPDGLGLQTVLWKAGVGNHASRAIAEHVGFQIDPGSRPLDCGASVEIWSGNLTWPALLAAS
ncbi:MAG: GNAT family N-acetyltransferase [Propionibacteriaceae bacterium]|jgi:RimJ/RimL family protein N-acetyltransferase|nr:GNAT family N-acetyltransferase [Propionibacteriaceae bacterium]